jgi:hypothetical protein
MLLRIALSMMAGILFAIPAAAAEKKPAELRDFPFWTGPKQPHARAFVPGLQAALQLTPEQVAKIEEACRETIDKPENKGKNAPGAAAARDKLFELVAGILTAEQKKQIEKVNDAYARAISDISGDFQARFAETKGNAEEGVKVRNAYQKAVIEAFEKKLDGILSNEQREAMTKAAEIEKKRAEEAKKTPKPGK